MKTVRCEPIVSDLWYTRKTIGWRIVDNESNDLLADGPYLNPLKEQVKEQFGEVHFLVEE